MPAAALSEGARRHCERTAHGGTVRHAKREATLGVACLQGRHHSAGRWRSRAYTGGSNRSQTGTCASHGTSTSRV